MSSSLLKALGWPQRIAVCVCALVLLKAGFIAAGEVERVNAPEQVRTLTPIKHVIVIIGENRSFDHVFGLYRPRKGQTISNLLSKGIVNADGTPGPNFVRAAQFQSAPQSSYYISAAEKTPYSTLPPPAVYGTPAEQRDMLPPFKSVARVAEVEPALEPADQALLTSGASGFSKGQSVDTRVANYGALPNGPYQLTGPELPYDSYTGDPLHRFFQMWQELDCRPGNATPSNPSGCLSDLYPFVAVSYASINVGGSNAMAIYNVNAGDAPLLKKLADTFTSSDNFHQAFMGGTGGNHVMLGTGDDVFFSDRKGHPAIPPTSQIANPNPHPGTNDRYILDGNWSGCSDISQPGVGPIVGYLRQLGLPSKCAGGHYYMINNTDPGFLPNGTQRTGAGIFVPPSNLRTIGDALQEKSISWAYYGGAFDAAVRHANGVASPTGALGAYCHVCNPFQYASSIMTNPALRTAHLKDVMDLFHDLGNGTLPSVSLVKPDVMLDGHPANSKLDLLEALVKNILDRLHANPGLARDTAVFITFDESGGYYDSGYIQPLDFFGDGPRIPLIVVSDYSRGGRIVHTYYDHVSILKFIERNWILKPLTTRSRDNLPNPVANADNPYVPRNRPTIGDLFEMFDFTRAAARRGARRARLEPPM
jgi:acid phosphatase